MPITKGRINNSPWKVFNNENKAKIIIELNDKLLDWHFIKKWGNYIIYDQKNRKKLYSSLHTTSFWRKATRIAPLVFFDEENNEVLRFNNHKSFSPHEIVIRNLDRYPYDWRKETIKWKHGMSKCDNEKGFLEFECEAHSINQALAISVVPWHTCTGPKQST